MINKAKSMRNGPDGAENSQRVKAFSATGETDFELFCEGQGDGSRVLHVSNMTKEPSPCPVFSRHVKMQPFGVFINIRAAVF